MCTVRPDQQQVNEIAVRRFRFVRGNGIQDQGDSGGPIMDAGGVAHAMTITGNRVDRAVAVSLPDAGPRARVTSRL
ncbi:hypothetical protein ACIQVT_25930 [Streptomyces sp. NPDC100445]|uniref:hypothetical protein n=1 Tax=Streptomyces sp. NPDC100445 TaxID=3366102 RepID=UPI00380B62A3